MRDTCLRKLFRMLKFLSEAFNGAFASGTSGLFFNVRRRIHVERRDGCHLPNSEKRKYSELVHPMSEMLTGRCQETEWWRGSGAPTAIFYFENAFLPVP